MRAAEVEAAIASVRAAWKNAPTIKTVQSVENLPDELRQQTANDAEGVFDPATKTAYLIGDNL
jgi:hypothetical protein